MTTGSSSVSIYSRQHQRYTKESMRVPPRRKSPVCGVNYLTEYSKLCWVEQLYFMHGKMLSKTSMSVYLCYISLTKNLTSKYIMRHLNTLSLTKNTRKRWHPCLKCCKGRIIFTKLHQILYFCWREGEVPKNIRDTHIIPLYKKWSTGAIAIIAVFPLPALS